MKQQDLIEKVSNQIIEKLQNLEGKWEQPFVSLFAYNVLTKKPYRGINILLLNCAVVEQKLTSSVWGTFKQWKDKGYTVKKGEKSTTVLFWKPLTFKNELENEETGETEELENHTYMARCYSVFNGSQIEGFTSEIEKEEFSLAPDAQTFFDNTDISYDYGYFLAAYSHETDIVLMPNKSDFINEQGFVATLAHETIHATGHKNRLNRDFSGRFGTQSYAFEELVADIGAGFVAGYLGYEYQFSKDNLAYLKSWLKVLKNDKRAIFKACSEAQRAFDYLMSFQHQRKEAV
jgi:antirestriction protein ArdC